MYRLLITGLACYCLACFHNISTFVKSAPNYLFGEKQPQLHCGLKNVSYSCYANTLIQCIRHIDVMERFLLSSDVEDALRAATDIDNLESEADGDRYALGQFLLNFNTVVGQLQAAENSESSWLSAVDTRPIMGSLQAAAPKSFELGAQHDPHELFMFFHSAVESILPERSRQSWLDLFMIRQGILTSDSLILHFPQPLQDSIHIIDLIREAFYPTPHEVEADSVHEKGDDGFGSGDSAMDVGGTTNRDDHAIEEDLSSADNNGGYFSLLFDIDHCSVDDNDAALRDRNDEAMGHTESLLSYESDSDCSSEDSFMSTSSGFDSDYESATDSAPWLIELSPVLILMISRSAYSNQGFRINTSVVIPEVLDLVEMVDQPNAVYHLTAVCNHSGNRIDCGHYHAVIKTVKGWAYFDDERTGRLAEFPATDVASTAYLLFYTRDK